MIYLDNAATTEISPRVLNAMMPYLTKQYGNAGTLYNLGIESARAIANARYSVARLIGSKTNEIIFTSGGSESNSMVFNGVKNYLELLGKKHIVISKIEHDSVIKAAKNLIKDGFHLTYLPVNSYGIVDTDELKQILETNNDVGLVSVMSMNNEIGSVNPVEYIGKICKEKEVLFHTDCVQCLGSDVINTSSWNCDFLSLSSHKIHGPKGVGALYIRENVMKNILQPLIHGGASQEFGFRGGTENVAGIVGFGEACNVVFDNFTNNVTHVLNLKLMFYETLIKGLTDNKLEDLISINGYIGNRSKVLNIRIRNIDGETMVLLLDSLGICVSAGSACRSHESSPSHVLTGIGLSDDEARDSIRISFSAYNTEEEVITAANEIVNCIMVLEGVDGC